MTTRPKPTYIFIRDLPTPPGRKTRIREVLSLSGLYRLGTIRWFGRWRQYVFAPEPDTVFSPGCMVAINAEIQSLMDERKQSDQGD